MIWETGCKFTLRYNNQSQFSCMQQFSLVENCQCSWLENCDYFQTVLMRDDNQKISFRWLCRKWFGNEILAKSSSWFLWSSRFLIRVVRTLNTAWRHLHILHFTLKDHPHWPQSWRRCNLLHSLCWLEY